MGENSINRAQCYPVSGFHCGGTAVCPARNQDPSIETWWRNIPKRISTVGATEFWELRTGREFKAGTEFSKGELNATTASWVNCGLGGNKWRKQVVNTLVH